MEVTLFVDSTFDSAHSLKGYVGPCSHVHGHTYKVEVWVRGDSTQLDEQGILFDFSNLKTIIADLDHKYLNDILAVSPSAEHIAGYVYKRLHEISKKELLFKVRIYENAVLKTAWAEVGDFVYR
jgi:6-pyruvoyltetrahydropterin/6-carboxytetrahydropterin synthase